MLNMRIDAKYLNGFGLLHWMVFLWIFLTNCSNRQTEWVYSIDDASKKAEFVIKKNYESLVMRYEIEGELEGGTATIEECNTAVDGHDCDKWGKGTIIRLSKGKINIKDGIDLYSNKIVFRYMPDGVKKGKLVLRVQIL